MTKLIIVLSLLFNFLLSACDEDPVVRCSAAHADAALAWTTYATALREAPVTDFSTRFAAMEEPAVKKAQDTCYANYGLDPNDALTDATLRDLVGGCLEAVLKVRFKEWPNASEAVKLAEVAKSGSAIAFVQSFEAFKTFEGPAVQFGPSHLLAYQSANNLISACSVEALARK